MMNAPIFTTMAMLALVTPILALVADGPVVIAAVGDSITWGDHSSDPDTKSYVTTMAPLRLLRRDARPTATTTAGAMAAAGVASY